MPTITWNPATRERYGIDSEGNLWHVLPDGRYEVTTLYGETGIGRTAEQAYAGLTAAA